MDGIVQVETDLSPFAILPHSYRNVKLKRESLSSKIETIICNKIFKITILNDMCIIVRENTNLC